MSFLDDMEILFKEAGKSTVDIAKTMSDKAGDMIESAKINTKIRDEQVKIAKEYAHLGEYAYNKAKGGADVDLEVRAHCDVIDASNAVIAEMEAERNKLKEQSNAQNEAIKASAAQTGAAFKNVAGSAAAGATGLYNTAAAKVKDAVANARSSDDEKTEGAAAYEEAVNNVSAPTEDGPACPACGAVNAADATVCAKCGTTLLTVPTEAPAEDTKPAE